MPRRRNRGPHQPVDSLARQIVRANPGGLLPWLYGIDGLTPVRPLDTAFITAFRTTDTLWQATLPDGTVVYLLIEFELTPNHLTLRRANAYTSHAESTTDLDVLTIVVCLEPLPNGQALGNTFTRSRDEWYIKRQIKVINLWEHESGQAFTPGLEGLLPFVPFMRGGDDETTIARAIEELRQHGWSQDIELLVLYLVQRLRGDDGLVRLGRRLNMQTLKRTPWYADIVEEGRQEGLRQGLQQGLREGREEGLLAGSQRARAEVLRLICTERFAPLTPEQATWLASLDAASIDSAIRLAISAATLDEVIAAVGRH